MALMVLEHPGLNQVTTPDNYPYWYQGTLVTHNNVPVINKDGNSWSNAYNALSIHGADGLQM